MTQASDHDNNERRLPERAFKILDGLKSGATRRQIAGNLGITEAALAVHIRRLANNLGSDVSRFNSKITPIAFVFWHSATCLAI